ncbi:condensation domain-containing protein [Micromonosporaceae bacterium Da 78-11]
MNTTEEPLLVSHDLAVTPLSHAQQRLWYIDGAQPGTATYNVPFLMRWTEPIDPAALARALEAVTSRHRVLSTVYRLVDGQPVQRLLDAPLDIRLIALADQSDPERQLADEAAAAGREPFDLAVDRPLRCTVWTGAPDGDAMLLTFHHIAVDGWSMAVLFADLDTAYGAALAGLSIDLARPELQYADFAVWDRQTNASERARGRAVARAAQLRPYVADLVLGRAGTGRPPTATGRGGQVVFEVGGSLLAAVNDLATTLRATPFVVLLAAYQVVLQRWSGREEFLVGTVTANRPHPAVEELVGFFVNTVPLRCGPQHDQTFAQLCTAVRAEAFAALTHQLIPFDVLSAELGGPGPVVRIGFALQNMPAYTPPEPRWHAPIQLPTGTAKFDLFLILDERPDGIVGTFEYDLGVYSAPLASQLAGHFQVLLAAAVDDPHRFIRQLPLTVRDEGQPPPCVLVGPTRDLVALATAASGSAA